MPNDEQYLRDLSKHIGQLTTAVKKMDERAREDRTARLALEQQLTVSVNKVTERQSDHELDIAALKSQMSRVEPVVKEVTGMKARMAGALLVLGLIGSAVLTTLAFFREQVVHLAARLFGG